MSAVGLPVWPPRPARVGTVGCGLQTFSARAQPRNMKPIRRVEQEVCEFVWALSRSAVASIEDKLDHQKISFNNKHIKTDLIFPGMCVFFGAGGFLDFAQRLQVRQQVKGRRSIGAASSACRQSELPHPNAT